MDIKDRLLTALFGFFIGICLIPVILVFVCIVSWEISFHGLAFYPLLRMDLLIGFLFSFLFYIGDNSSGLK